MNERAQQLAAHLAAVEIDEQRDREFYEAPARFITRDEIKHLAEVLSDSDDNDVRIGLSEIGIDPCSFSDDELDAIHGEVFGSDT